MLKTLAITNYKCLNDASIELKNITFLAGGNAAGKSSFVQSVLFLRELIQNKCLINPTDILGTNLGLPQDLLSFSRKVNVISLRGKINDEAFKLIISPSKKNVFHFELDECCTLSDALRRLHICYIGADRIGAKTLSVAGQSLNNYVGARGENTIDVLSRIESQSKITEGKESFIREVEESLSDIFGNTSVQIDSHNYIATSVLRVKNQYDYYLPTATGFGISYSLPIIVQGLALLGEANKVLIVENPEAHLHPRSQSKLGSFLAKLACRGLQLIVETHSEHIINGARLYMLENGSCNKMNIYFFENVNERYRQTEICVDENGELDNWPKGFFDQSEEDLSKLIFKTF